MGQRKEEMLDDSVRCGVLLNISKKDRIKCRIFSPEQEKVMMYSVSRIWRE